MDITLFRKEDEKLLQKKGFLDNSAAMKKGRWEGM